MATTASSPSTMKVTYVGSGASAPFATRAANVSPSSSLPSARVATAGSSSTTIAAATTAAALSAANGMSSSMPVSPQAPTTSPALQTDTARLCPYVSLVRPSSDASRRFGPPTLHSVSVLPRPVFGASTAATPAGGGATAMYTSYTPVTAMAAARFPSTAAALTPTPTSRLTSTTAVASAPGTSTPLPATAASSSAASAPLAKPPIARFMSDHTYVTLRDAAGRPIAAPPLDLVPPFRYAVVEDGVYRGAYPVLRNLPFLKTLGLRTIISLVPEDPTFDLQTFCDAEKIDLHHIQAERFKGETQLLPTDLNTALNIILSVNKHPVYIHCLDGKQVTGLVVMGLRKLMQWDIQCAHNEYLRFCSGEVEDEVAFMADYTGPITIPARVPAWISGLYATDARGVQRPRKYNCGLKLKYPAEEDRTRANTTAAAPGRGAGGVGGVDAGSASAVTVPGAASGECGGLLLQTQGFANEAVSRAELARPGSPSAAAAALNSSAAVEGVLTAEEAKAALSLSLPWSELVDERGVYFDVAHIGQHTAAAAGGSSSSATAGPIDRGGAGHSHPRHRHASSSLHDVRSGSAENHHLHNHNHNHNHTTTATGSNNNNSYPPLSAAATVSDNNSKVSSNNASVVLSYPVPSAAVAGHSQSTSATSTPPFAPISNITPSTFATTTAGTAAPVDPSLGAAATPAAAGQSDGDRNASGGGGGGGHSHTHSSAGSSAAATYSAPATSAGGAAQIPAVSLAYFSLGRPGGSLQSPATTAGTHVQHSSSRSGRGDAGAGSGPGSGQPSRHTPSPLASGGGGGGHHHRHDSGANSNGISATPSSKAAAGGGGADGGGGAGRPAERTGTPGAAAHGTGHDGARRRPSGTESTGAERSGGKNRPKRRYSL